MKKLLCLMAGVMIITNLYAQQNEITPYFVNQRIPDLHLTNLINYKDTTCTLSSFGHKLILLDFWNTHCTACVALFPKEDSLQNIYKNFLQIILVTSDPRIKVESYLRKWNAQRTKTLDLPIVTEDRFIFKYFRHMYIPHYVWIAPDGQVLGETSDAFVNGNVVEELWHYILKKENDLKKRHFSDRWFHFPELNRINQNRK